ncbi:DUF2793 domain-containing protein [Devosia sp. YIM 151766]|uniref:DUF2793 domain-containing protein n=1 Tax=Devosia sp. YIM 151766 TaxID=3017325 RepID=UPI00255C73B5|nr:DUF2793 domain-containing protein [Devosia sp. YIM 151766]WIY52467.1 DUF2793 domain-containing protein [Devosia sp. YIM 151766]
MSDSANLLLPYISASQAQKHVTHNESIRLLDGMVQLAVKDRDLAEPPGSPSDGDRYLVASGGSGAWMGWDWNIAYRADGVWMKLHPRPGWLCWVIDEDLLLAFDGSAWAPVTSGGGGSEGYALKSIIRLYSGTSLNLGSDITAVLIKAVGGGGGGGGAQGGVGGGAVGGGGAGGAYVEAFKTGVSAATLTFAIGAGGSAGASIGGNGGAGGVTSISDGNWTLEAQGGTGGSGQTTGNMAQVVEGGYGQNASGGDLNVAGQPGSGGIRLDAQNNLAGAGAASPFGSGGQAFSGNATGQQGLGHGAGGGGGAVADNAMGQAGGAGSAGYIEVVEYIGGNSHDMGDPFNFSKALTGRYRIGLFGTSLAQRDYGTFQKFKETVRNKWGDAGSQSQIYGGLGGTYDGVFQGWYRQYFGGAGHIRLRGQSSSVPIREIVYGDQLDLFWSQEMDAAEFTVTIDGNSHSVGAAGAQAYGQMARFNLPLGPHELIITPPPSGYCYIERHLCRNTLAVGVEVEDFTLGGSTLRDAVVLRSKTGSLVDGIAIDGGNGIAAWHGVPDLDLVIITHTVNDAGTLASAGGWVRGGDFATALGDLLDGYRTAGVPVIYAIEMAGHFIMPNDAGNANYHTAFNQLKADILAQNDNGVWVLDWDGVNRNDADIPAYAATFYSSVSGLNLSAGTYSGDFIHPDSIGYRALDDLLSARTGIPIPYDSDITRQFTARYRSFPLKVQGSRTVTIDSTPKTLAAIAAAAQPLVPALSNGGRVGPVFADVTASTIAGVTATRNDIAVATNTDAFGKYVDLSGSGIWGFAGGQNCWLTLKMSGNGNIRANGPGVRICVDGEAMPFTDPGNGRTSISWKAGTAGIDGPILVAVQLQTTAEGQTVNVSGRVYDIAVTRSDYPVLLTA